jgi:hypothetical protein
LITCYAQPDKEKSRRVLEAFTAGCGGRMANTTARALEPGAAAFYGVRAPWLHLWEQAKREGRDWYYLDNSYFDCARELQFRVTKNALQHTGRGVSDGKRFAALGIEIKPMREDGENVIVCPSSVEFMRAVAGDPGWLDRVTRNLRRQYKSGCVIVRTKQEKRPLLVDLERARLLVTWASAAAVTALLQGVPVMCAPECCATYAQDRAPWAAVLADNQWTLAEIRNGTAWRTLNAV